MWLKVLKQVLSPFLADSTEEKMLDEETQEKVDANLRWQNKLGWRLSNVCKALGSTNITFVESASFVKGVKRWQRRKGLAVDGIIGPNTWEQMQLSLLTPKEKAIRKIMEPTIGKESSGRYWAMNKDGEFRGLFDNHRAEGKIHIGLSFGILQFTQDGGSLGDLLQRCAKKNPRKFKDIFGKTWSELLRITTRDGLSGLESNTLRGPRVEPVPIYRHDERRQAIDIWRKPWTTRFNKFGHDPEFQAEQRQLAVESYLEPMLPFLRKHGFMSEKMVAAAFSGAIHRGVSGMQGFMKRRMDEAEVKKEAATLGRMAAVDDRYETFLNDLTWDRWDGWKYYKE